MKAEHKAVIARARKDGMQPSEIASELLLHDLVQASINQLSKHEVGFRKMSEKQQDAVIAELQSDLKASALLAARLIAGANTATVEMTLKDLKVSNGQLVGIVKSTEENYNDLISKVQDKSDVLIVLYERDYFDALDGIQSEKDQKPLDLDSDAPEKPEKKTRAASGAKAAGGIAKAIELPPKLVEDARAFIIDQQNCKASALQNFLKCNFGKAEALQKLFESEGLIEFVGTDASGDYELVRKPAAETGDLPAGTEEFEVPEFLEVAPITELTDDLYASIVAKTTEKGQATAGALAVTFDISFEIAEQAFDRMELEGVIDAEGNLAESETFPVMD